MERAAAHDTPFPHPQHDSEKPRRSADALTQVPGTLQNGPDFRRGVAVDGDKGGAEGGQKLQRQFSAPGRLGERVQEREAPGQMLDRLAVRRALA